MGLRAANRPLLDKDGFATGIVTRSEFGKGVEVVTRSRDDVDSREYERFELEIAVEGTGGVIPMKVYAGTALNGVLEEVGKGKAKKPLYNRISTLAIGLGLVTPEELEGVIDQDVMDRVQKGLEGLEGDKLKFKLGKVEGKALTVPIPDTIRRVE